ncbi:MAG: ribonuclease III, partial [Pseudobutyrivibrio sp.]|nr:ribonuclease III [Pseudobutyrivibrio sp.]
ATSVVNARMQAEISVVIMDYLTSDEKDIFRRGRNSKPHTKAKNASTMEYLEATGLEALVGYLYLKDDMDRICELLKIGLEKAEIEI